MKQYKEEIDFLLQLLKDKEEQVGLTGGDFHVRFVLAFFLIRFNRNRTDFQPGIDACKEIMHSTLKYYHFDQFPEFTQRMIVFCKKMQEMDQ